LTFFQTFTFRITHAKIVYSLLIKADAALQPCTWSKSCLLFSDLSSNYPHSLTRRFLDDIT